MLSKQALEHVDLAIVDRLSDSDCQRIVCSSVFAGPFWSQVVHCQPHCSKIYHFWLADPRMFRFNPVNAVFFCNHLLHNTSDIAASKNLPPPEPLPPPQLRRINQSFLRKS
jgi:hypothetical protein